MGSRVAPEKPETLPHRPGPYPFKWEQAVGEHAEEKIR